VKILLICGDPVVSNLMLCRVKIQLSTANHLVETLSQNILNVIVPQPAAVRFWPEIADITDTKGIFKLRAKRVPSLRGGFSYSRWKSVLAHNSRANLLGDDQA
jgi:hypothetical protein